MKFYLGGKASWIANPRFDGVPICVSRRVMPKQALPRATTHWILDSGGFTEVTKYGGWSQVHPRDYARFVARCRDEIGMMQWAAPQDWMCEPIALAATGLTIETHQRRTVENYIALRNIDASLPIIPVLQGWSIDDYLRCIELYEIAGVHLSYAPTVGIGSVCRRQSTREIHTIIDRIQQEGIGIRLHGFGVKTRGLEMYATKLFSADSAAWSFRARYQPPLPGCIGHKNCANCATFALQWHQNLLQKNAQVV